MILPKALQVMFVFIDMDVGFFRTKSTAEYVDYPKLSFTNTSSGMKFAFMPVIILLDGSLRSLRLLQF